ncbi:MULTISPECIES: IDEAL domain-containing protein [Allobacillus]|nr:IDEAL domain-containing protein [Allobacillus salarius]
MMKKQFSSYKLSRLHFSNGHLPIMARKEMNYEIKLAARLILDEAIYQWNKENLETKIDAAIDNQNEKEFHRLSKQYAHYVIHE